MVVSPRAEGADLATRLRETGHAVVTYGEAVGLPLVAQKDLYQFARASDLVVVDESFPLVRTRRSYRPHQDALFFDELRRAYDIKALGPTPTIDLLIGDARYLKKWCGKLGIAYDTKADGESWSSGAWFRKDDVIPPGPLLESWKPLFKAVGFRGWFELRGVIGADGPIVQAAVSTWPVEQIPAGQEADFLRRISS